MENLLKIAVATDFSPNARTAYKFGQALCQIAASELILIHIFQKLKSEKETKETMTRLRRFANDKSVNCQTFEGTPLRKLLSLSQENHFDWLVIGIKEEQGLFDKLFKSVHSNLVKNATCPVLLIPKRAKIPPKITNIAYAVSALSCDEEGIKTISDIARLLNAKIHFIHVNRPGYSDKKIHVEDLMDNIAGVGYCVKELDYVTVRGAVESYCEANAIDIVVSMTKKYSFWGRLFHNSITESLIWNTNFPLMVLHKKGK